MSRVATTGARPSMSRGEPPKLLHVSRSARERFGLTGARFGLYGRVLELDPAAAADWSRLVAVARRSEGAGGAEAPVRTFSPAELLAAVALHELMHALVGELAAPGGPFAGALERVRQRVEGELGAGGVAAFVGSFQAAYVPASGERRAPEPLAGGEGEAALEELLLLELARRNEALLPLRELFEAPEFTRTERYAAAVRALEAGLGAKASPLEGGVGGAGAAASAGGAPSLLELLLEPQRRAPASILEQLKVAVELWRPYLAGRYDTALLRALRAADLLAEEAKWAPAAPGPPPLYDHAAVVPGETEAFTPDAPWMPGVVLVAKSTYVWLHQLSQAFGRPVTRLDDVPGEALDELADNGFNALWLIGVWRRSEASRTIKRLKGQQDALASAYSIHDYEVAPELGGEEALARLAARAAERGLRLASDMVPNHTAIDGAWVAEHPDRFVQTASKPYPSYSYTGPDLSSDPAMSLYIEDGYWSGSDAAVVFKRVDRGSGEARYIYHGNDGTALPWNDTAQLDFLNPEVRRAVIDTTVEVARRFPIIRLDAAMTLARQHVRRLWHPEPGKGGAIPSRSALGLSQGEFDRLMPSEFWRELVDALAERAPGTMLLAEAFWLMEVYFVRSLGMNRVYNSAFMHMTMKEENAAYRRYLKNYLASEPRVLERFVNYMSNPDEESAAEQYGDGDKAFGVATLLATLPGLPMFGHGQVEGLREKYGMEFAAPRLGEEPRGWHVERHRREIAPLLQERRLFAGSERFRLFDLVAEDGAVAEDVYAYTNDAGGRRVLVLFNNSPSPTGGRLKRSAPTRQTNGEVRSEELVDALGLTRRADGEVVLTRFPAGEEERVPTAEVITDGLALSLGPYEARVYLEVRQEPAGAGGALWREGGREQRGRRGREGRSPLPLQAAARGAAALRRAKLRRRAGRLRSRWG